VKSRGNLGKKKTLENMDGLESDVKNNSFSPFQNLGLQKDSTLLHKLEEENTVGHDGALGEALPFERINLECLHLVHPNVS
jgi:hypothetical protein